MRRPDDDLASDGDARWRPLAGGAAVLALFAVAIVGLGAVLERGEWTSWALAVTAATIGGSTLARTVVPRWRTGSCVVGLVAGAALVVTQVAVAGRLGDWLSDPGRLVQGARVALYTGSAPVQVQGGLMDLVLVACLSLAWMSALLVIGMDARLLGGIVPAALLVIGPAVTSLRVPGVLLGATGALLVALLWIGAPRRRGAWRGVVAVVATVALTGGVAALLPPGRDRVWNAAAVSAGPVADGVPDVTIALGEDLRARSTTPVLRYENVAKDTSTRFTLAVLTDFDEGTWRPDDQLDADGSSVSDLRPPLIAADGASSWTSTTAATLRIPIRIEGLLSAWLPVSQGTQRVVPQGTEDGSWTADDWRWVADTQTVRSTSAVTTRDDAYITISCPLLASQLPSPCGSLGDGTSWPVAARSPADLAPLLELPDGVPAAVTEAAADITSGATTRSAAAEALTTWFRAFTYDEAAPYEPGADPEDPYQTMTAFLDQRRGYCVHFATTFAVMARSLGMPARVAVGYASRSGGPGWNSVSGVNLHAWPEIYYEGVGWVAYEPTPGGAGARADAGTAAEPGAQSGPDDSPSAAAPEPTSTPGGAPTGSQSGAQNPEEGSRQSGEPSGGDGAGTGIAPAVAWILVAVLLALLVPAVGPALVRGVRRRRRRRAIAAGPAPAAAAWAEFVDTALDLGILTAGLGAIPFS